MRVADLADLVPQADLVGLSLADPDADVVDLTHDSRRVGPGVAFACIVGQTVDGHEFAADAVAAGAPVLIVERPLDLPVAQIVVDDVRRLVGVLAAAVQGNPAERLTMVGITGTNGKTTTAHLLGAILRADGRTVEVIGTLSGTRTTPEATDLQRQLAGALADGIDTVVMEVSSHALALHRVSGILFDVAAFTNLGRDHLDLHESMEAYFRAKASLFEPDASRVGAVNRDDPHGRLLLDAASIGMIGFGESDVSDVRVSAHQHAFVWRGHEMVVPLGGAFNVSNSIAALSVAAILGVRPAIAATGLAECEAVPGRFELVSDPDADPFSVIVDYAHTPDGLAGLLESGRRLAVDSRVTVVFGCGGDRDAHKRPLMGAAAAQGADTVFITSDNPRHEDPFAIVAETAAGVPPDASARVLIEVDRTRAIEQAIAGAEPGDVVLIAGKGHEATQTIGDQTIDLDDREVARSALARLRCHSKGERR